MCIQLLVSYLHREPVVVVGDDQVEARVKPCPPPDVLTIRVQSSAAPQTFSVKSVLVKILRPLVNPAVEPQQRHPAGVVGAGHPGVGNDLVGNQHLHVHVVVDKVRKPYVSEHG